MYCWHDFALSCLIQMKIMISGCAAGTNLTVTGSVVSIIYTLTSEITAIVTTELLGMTIDASKCEQQVVIHMNDH